ncbi:hypothetical protein PFICI_11853 [Pestalotiopsis fici W106-1]|uniref:Enoyl reductase (ER) domain-containing protein n=1 Tax=Pestalotiopsis fici (strain W106-1 / CGMCC3.15140) TaxID=1229662 RepID=W3WUC8_PESFW|nr:uncharacterized protein PFICI_11853 [Pestalotiopsis fici W106-1]ETS76466.1 hypothetical protein PFICI_11853 [Pestalotiopsis fici W106-1]
MKAVQVIGDSSSPHIICNQNVPRPIAQGRQILVQVHAAGITADEVTWPELYRTASRIPGHDVSGTIAFLGPDYDGPLKVGQEVYALLHADRGEGQAEFVICHADEIASKPSSISHAEAAALPIPALTAWEAIADHVKIGAVAKVLVTGASGAVGSIFVQLVKHLTGAKVIALASPNSHSVLKRLGADEVLDYHIPDWEKLTMGVDVVFDTVGGEMLTKTWETVSDEGTIITVADPPPPWAFGRGPAAESAAHPGVRYVYFIVSPNSRRLAEVAKFIDDGVVEALKVRTFSIEHAEQAWSNARGRNRGYKAVIDMTMDS